MAQHGEAHQIVNAEGGEGYNRRDALRRYFAQVNDGACTLRTEIMRQQTAPDNQADNYDNTFQRVRSTLQQVFNYYEREVDICICDNPNPECEGYCDPVKRVNLIFVELLNLIGEICIKQVVEGLPSIKISENQVNENVTCAICLSDFEAAEVVCQLRCNEQHIFHRHCIKKWFEKQNHCPICREPAYFKTYSFIRSLFEGEDVVETS